MPCGLALSLAVPLRAALNQLRSGQVILGTRRLTTSSIDCAAPSELSDSWGEESNEINDEEDDDQEENASSQDDQRLARRAASAKVPFSERPRAYHSLQYIVETNYPGFELCFTA